MSITFADQDNIGEHHEISETKNDTSIQGDTNDDLEKSVRYKKLIEMGKIYKEYIEDGIKMEVKFDQLEDTDLDIVLEGMQNKEHPLRDLQLSWEKGDKKSNISGFIELAKVIGSHTTLVKFKFDIYSISNDQKTEALFRALKDNHSIKHLLVDSQEFDLATACAFMKTLANNQSLLSLSISAFHPQQRENDLTPPGSMAHKCAVALTRLLQTTVLERLKICKINDEDLKELFQSLPKSLVYLDLSENDIDKYSFPIFQSYLKSNGNALKVLILNESLVAEYLEQQESSSLSTVKIISSSSWQALLFREDEPLIIKPDEMNDSDWSMLFMELTKDITTYREIELCLCGECDRNHLNYIQTLLSNQFRLTRLNIVDCLEDRSIQVELFRLLTENNSINKLQFSNTPDSIFMSELVNFLVNKNHILLLDLSGCSTIGDEEVIMLAHSLKTNTVLQSFALYPSKIGDTGFQALLSSLPNSLSQLKLEDSLISGNSLPSLLAFIKTHPMLKHISLKKNGITTNSAPEINIPDLLEKIHKITNANHCICELEVNQKMKEKIVQSMSYIDLSFEQLRDYDMLELYYELKKEPNQNWSLNLLFANSISPIGYCHLADILSSGISIIGLSIGNNSMNEEAKTNFLNGLRDNKTLEMLKIDSEKLNNQHMEYIECFIHNNSALKELTLENCGIDADSSIHLAKVLPESSLEVLKLKGNSLDDRACASILSSIPATLTKLSFNTNQITESSLQPILLFLAANQTLKELDFSSNPISDDSVCMQKLNEAAQQNNICELREVY